MEAPSFKLLKGKQRERMEPYLPCVMPDDNPAMDAFFRNSRKRKIEEVGEKVDEIEKKVDYFERKSDRARFLIEAKMGLWDIRHPWHYFDEEKERQALQKTRQAEQL